MSSMNAALSGQEQDVSITKNDLTGLSNAETAKKLYGLLENMILSEVLEIAEYIKIIAINLKA